MEDCPLGVVQLWLSAAGRSEQHSRNFTLYCCFEPQRGREAREDDWTPLTLSPFDCFQLQPLKERLNRVEKELNLNISHSHHLAFQVPFFDIFQLNFLQMAKKAEKDPVDNLGFELHQMMVSLFAFVGGDEETLLDQGDVALLRDSVGSGNGPASKLTRRTMSTDEGSGPANKNGGSNAMRRSVPHAPGLSRSESRAIRAHRPPLDGHHFSFERRRRLLNLTGPVQQVPASEDRDAHLLEMVPLVSSISALRPHTAR